MSGGCCPLRTNLSYKLTQGHSRRFRISVLNVLRQFPKFFNNRVGKIMNLDRNYGFTDRSIIEMKRRSRHRLFRTRTFDYILGSYDTLEYSFKGGSRQ